MVIRQKDTPRTFASISSPKDAFLLGLNGHIMAFSASLALAFEEKRWHIIAGCRMGCIS
jgi:hypothetical protein